MDSNGSGIKKGGVVDEEAGEVEEANPLFEGNPEMAAKMHLLLPAVGIGVSGKIF